MVTNMHSSIRSLILATLLTSSCALTSSCGRPNSNQANASSGEEQTELVALRREVLGSITNHVIVPTYETFITKAEALTMATRTLSSEPGSDQARETAQEAWRDAMTTWQMAEVFQVGPAGLMEHVAGGEDLRDTIYSWPLTNTCRLDQELVKKAYTEPDYIASQLINVRGLDALEYLLFQDGSQNSCAPNAPINSDGSWDALSTEELTQRRAELALVISEDLSQQAVTLHDHWRSGDGGKDFQTEFVQAGVSSKTYASTQEALNALSDAMFYIEKETKDMKLAIPAGLSDCTTETCPEALEHRHAHFSLEASLANHRAFQALYLGHLELDAQQSAETRGFDDLLVEAGHADLDQQIQAQLSEAIAAHEAIDTSMAVALEEDLPAVLALYESSQKLGVLLKTQFISVLDLELPQRAEGDND